MSDKIIEMAKEAGLKDWWDGGNENYNEFIEHLSRLVDLVLEEALNCYSPDDTAQDWADKICALKGAEMKREDLQKVRGALVAADNAILSVHGYNEALDILDRALAAPEQEPVAWQERRAIYRKGGVKWSEWYLCDYTSKQVAAARESTPSDEYEWRPLFATPPSREWQGLTNEEVVYTTFKTENEYCTPGWCMDFARAIESALRAKNTGEQA